MKAYLRVDVYSHVFLTSALVGGEWSASRPCLFTPQGRIPRYLLDRKLGGPQSRSGQRGEMKIVDTTGTRTPTSRSSNPVQILTYLSVIEKLKLCCYMSLGPLVKRSSYVELTVFSQGFVLTEPKLEGHIQNHEKLSHGFCSVVWMMVNGKML
jgi:hypothetical protein